MKSALALCLTLLLAACSDPAPPVSAPGVAGAGTERHELGRKIYNFRCYFCHGYSGDAQTLASTYLAPRPRDFKATDPGQLSRAQMLDVTTRGKAGSAMRGFEGILSADEIAAVTDFVRQEFMIAKAANTRYHTVANGWPEHERYSAAFPFVTGAVKLDTPPEQLNAGQQAGRRLFMSACISCHDRAHVKDAGAPWDARPLSYPRMGFAPGDDQVDAIASATPYHLHDKPPKLAGLSVRETRGEALFQNNCAFCHAADGTGRNWIGSFLEPHPRDLTLAANMTTMTRQRLSAVIREGLPGTSMPAWKSVLSADDIDALGDYIGRAFHPLAPAPVPARPEPSLK